MNYINTPPTEQEFEAQKERAKHDAKLLGEGAILWNGRMIVAETTINTLHDEMEQSIEFHQEEDAFSEWYQHKANGDTKKITETDFIDDENINFIVTEDTMRHFAEISGLFKDSAITALFGYMRHSPMGRSRMVTIDEYDQKSGVQTGKINGFQARDAYRMRGFGVGNKGQNFLKSHIEFEATKT